MNKIINSLIMAVIIALVGVACKKTTQTTTQGQPIESISNTLPTTGFKGLTKSEKGFLVFDNEENYNSFLDIMKNLPESEWDKWEAQLNFTSLRTTRKLQNKMTSVEDFNDDVEDNLFLTFIDQYGVVQIGNTIFKAETDIDFVWTLSASHIEKYGSLLGRTFDANTMNIFRISLDENRTNEVWDIVNSGTVGVDESGNGGQGKTTGMSGVDDEQYQYDDTTDSNCPLGNREYRAKAKTSYQTAIFYYSLITEFKYSSRCASANTFTDMENTDIILINNNNGFGTYCHYKKVNSSNHVYPAYPTGWVFNDNKLTWRPYSGTRKVNPRELRGQFQYKCKVTGNFKIIETRI